MATTINTPTTAAIETAIKNADKMWEQGYTVAQSSFCKTIWVVTKPDAARTLYTVDVTPGYVDCPCEQFKREHICKHVRFVQENIRIEAMEEEAAAREFEEAAREEAQAAFLLSPSAIQGQAMTVPAGAPGACEFCGCYPFDDIDGEPLNYCTGCEDLALGKTRRFFR